MAILLLLALTAQPVDFDTDILPILTKAGCNAGACHGAAAGRGGFHLSLFGGDPAADHRAIVREGKGRRVNLADAEQSLLLRKPTWDLDHEGGQKIDVDGSDYQTLIRWIEQGATRQQTRSLVGLQVSVSPKNTAKLPAEILLKAVATYSDGSTRDVTEHVAVTPSDSASLQVVGAGKLRLLRGGRHNATVRYVSRVASVQVSAPVGETVIDATRLPSHNFIDEEVNRVLAELRLPPHSTASDAALLRRVSLDLTGSLPAPERIKKYLADKSPDKFKAAVDELLASESFTIYWTHRFEEWLRVRPPGLDRQAGEAMHHWIKEQVAAKTGVDEIAFQLITAQGDTHEVGAATFHRLTGDARSEAEHISETLLGVRLACANCHNHPLDVWTQDDYHGLAAIFARLDKGRVVSQKTRGEVSHPRTGEAAIPRIPGERFLSPNEDGRKPLADWLTDTSNPYFARAVANRLWKSMMGRGLVEPVDDLRATNPATHPALLNRLAEEFKRHKFRIRPLLRTIALSATYQRVSSVDTSGEVARKFYAVATAKPLSAAVLADAITHVTGEPFKVAGFAEKRTIAIFDPTAESPELDTLGRCSRTGSCESGPATSSELTRSLDLLNGDVLNRRVASRTGRLHQLIAAGKTNEQIVGEFYLLALGRPCSARETSHWKRALDTSKRIESLEDFVWSLLASRSFAENR